MKKSVKDSADDFLDNYFDVPLEKMDKEAIVGSISEEPDISARQITSSLVLAYFLKKAKLKEDRLKEFFDRLIKEKSLIMCKKILAWNGEICGVAILKDPESFFGEKTFGDLQEQVSTFSLLFHSTYFQYTEGVPDSDVLLAAKNGVFDRLKDGQTPVFYREVDVNGILCGIAIAF